MASLWCPEGPWPDFWDTGEHNKRHFDVQAWIFTEFWWILVPREVICHAWCLYFGVLGDPGTILGRSWDIGEYKKGHFEVQAWILLIFPDFGDHFESLLVAFGPIKIILHTYLQVVFLMIFGSEQGLKNQAFGTGGIAKIDFRSNWISHDSRVHFS